MGRPWPGSTAWFEALFTSSDNLEHYRKMFHLGLAGAMVGFLTALWTAAVVDSAWMRVPVVGLNVLCAATNAFMAGKWARRMEQAWLEEYFGGRRHL